MKWGAVFGITAIVILMTLFEWPTLHLKPKKEKAAFLTLLGIGWILAVLLTIFPDMPGPTQVIETIFKPLGKKLE